MPVKPTLLGQWLRGKRGLVAICRRARRRRRCAFWPGARDSSCVAWRRARRTVRSRRAGRLDLIFVSEDVALPDSVSVRFARDLPDREAEADWLSHPGRQRARQYQSDLVARSRRGVRRSDDGPAVRGAACHAAAAQGRRRRGAAGPRTGNRQRPADPRGGRPSGQSGVDPSSTGLLGFACDVANDGVEALAALEQTSYGCLITDCHMPNLSGYELARRIREREQGGTRSACRSSASPRTPRRKT